jgi:hypothetical protein
MALEYDLHLALTRSLIKEAFHFIPTLRVGFRFVNNTDQDRASQLMLQATTMLLLEQTGSGPGGGSPMLWPSMLLLDYPELFRRLPSR